MDDYIQDSAPFIEVDTDGFTTFDGTMWKVIPHDGDESTSCAKCHLSSIYGIREAGRKFCPAVPCRASENPSGKNCYLLCWKAFVR